MAQTQKQGRPEDYHQDEWHQDLSPQARAGQNYHLQGGQAVYPLNAYEIKELHSQLKGFSSDEMQQITVIPPGSPLEAGTKYLDLMDSERKVVTATAGMEAEPNSWYVPKNQVDYILWNRLAGL